MAKKGGSAPQVTTTTNTMDPMAQDYARKVMEAAQGAGQGGGTNAARSYYQSLMPGANLGMAAMAGDPNATSTLMNPFQGQVIDQLNNQFMKANALTSRGINDQATQAGAFGGSRHGVAEGVALGANADTHDARMADVMSQGYGDAMNRATSLANFGMAGAAGSAQLDPSMMRFMAMQQAGQGVPWGSTSTTSTPVNKNRAAGALGGAATGAQLGSMFGPWGTAIGGVGGGLMGLFS